MATWYKPKDLGTTKDLSDEAKLKKLGFIKLGSGIWCGPYMPIGIRIKA